MLSLIVTALNEERNVKPFLSSLRGFMKSSNISYEVIFVDDGSRDQTYQEIQTFKDWDQLKVIRNSHNLGTGASVKKALSHAGGNWYAWLPADLEVMPQELAHPLKHIDNFDVIVTYFQTGLSSRTISRRVLSMLFTKILNLTFGYRLPYYNGVTLIRRSILKAEEVKARGFFFHAELLLRTLRTAPRVTSVPINLTPRLLEKPKALSFKVLRDVATCFLHVLWDVKFKT